MEKPVKKESDFYSPLYVYYATTQYDTVYAQNGTRTISKSYYGINNGNYVGHSPAVIQNPGNDYYYNAKYCTDKPGQPVDPFVTDQLTDYGIVVFRPVNLCTEYTAPSPSFPKRYEYEFDGKGRIAKYTTYNSSTQKLILTTTITYKSN